MLKKKLKMKTFMDGVDIFIVPIKHLFVSISYLREFTQQ